MRKRAIAVAALLACLFGLSSCDVSKYDWLNRSYDAVCWNGMVVHAPLKDGGVLATTPAGQVLVYVDRFSYQYQNLPAVPNAVQGDITGDHVAEEVVLLDCAHRPLNTPMATQDLEVFTTGPKLIAHIPLPVLETNSTKWFPSRFDQVSIDNGHLVVSAWLYVVGDSSCCPGVHRQYTYNWDGHHFHVASIVALDNTYYPPIALGG